MSLLANRSHRKWNFFFGHESKSLPRMMTYACVAVHIKRATLCRFQLFNVRHITGVIKHFVARQLYEHKIVI